MCKELGGGGGKGGVAYTNHLKAYYPRSLLRLITVPHCNQLTCTHIVHCIRLVQKPILLISEYGITVDHSPYG